METVLPDMVRPRHPAASRAARRHRLQVQPESIRSFICKKTRRLSARNSTNECRAEASSCYEEAHPNDSSKSWSSIAMIILALLVFRSTSSTVDVPGWPYNTCSSRMLFLQRMLQTVRVQMPAAAVGCSGREGGPRSPRAREAPRSVAVPGLEHGRDRAMVRGATDDWNCGWHVGNKYPCSDGKILPRQVVEERRWWPRLSD